MSADRYFYKFYSRKDGEITLVSKYIDQITELPLEYISATQKERVKILSSGISEKFAGIILTFDSSMLIGFLALSQAENSHQNTEVTFASVATSYQEEGIWTHMLKMAEEESRKLGAGKIQSQISNHNYFLAQSLMKSKYIVEDAELDEGEDSWLYHPLVKTL